jgi:hypothetical protein
MTPALVLIRLSLAGCSLELAGDSLRLRGPRRALTPELLAALRANKPVLLAHFEAPDVNSLPLVAAEDLAELVDEHLAAGCAVCTRSAINVDLAGDLCTVGRLLHQHVLEARRSELEAGGGQSVVVHKDGHRPVAPVAPVDHDRPQVDVDGDTGAVALAPALAALDEPQAAEQPATRGPRREQRAVLRALVHPVDFIVVEVLDHERHFIDPCLPNDVDNLYRTVRRYCEKHPNPWYRGWLAWADELLVPARYDWGEVASVPSTSFQFRTALSKLIDMGLVSFGGYGGYGAIGGYCGEVKVTDKFERVLCQFGEFGFKASKLCPYSSRGSDRFV